MRKQYTEKLKKFFRKKLLLTRSQLNLTQDKMSERLAVSVRSYAELERGRSACSALTLALYLIYSCPDVETFLNELREAYESENEDLIVSESIS